MKVGYSMKGYPSSHVPLDVHVVHPKVTGQDNKIVATLTTGEGVV